MDLGGPGVTLYNPVQVLDIFYRKVQYQCKYDVAWFFPPPQIMFLKLGRLHQFWKGLWKWVPLGCTGVHCIAVVIIIEEYDKGGKQTA